MGDIDERSVGYWVHQIWHQIKNLSNNAGNMLQVKILWPLSGQDNVKVDVAESIAVQPGENHVGEVGGRKVRQSVQFTRPNTTTAYDIGDVVSNNATTSVLMDFDVAARVDGGSGYIVGIRVTTDKKSVVPSFRVHFFSQSNPTVSGDNLAYQDKYADIAKRLGWYDMPAMSTGTDTTNSDCSRAQDSTMRLPYVCAVGDRSVFVLLETLTAWTPAANERITVTLYFEQD